MSERTGGRRVGLVLGAGGMLGATWMIARLHQLEQATGYDLRGSELIVGSSAGSVLAAVLASGLSVRELLEHARGDAAPDSPLARSGFDYDSSLGAALPERPPLRIGSGTLLRRTARHPRQLGVWTALAAAAPPGRGSLAVLGSAVAAIRRELREPEPGEPDPGEPNPGEPAWPARLRVVALDYRTGDRVVFGEPGMPAASVPDAVMASSSIPGWFAPTVIGDRPYVDAGFRQATSADLLAGRALDEAYVLAPLATTASEPRPTTRLGRLERRYRRHLTRVLAGEVGMLRRTGIQPMVIVPDAGARAVMGVNLMNPHRRHDVLAAVLGGTAVDASVARAGEGR